MIHALAACALFVGPVGAEAADCRCSDTTTSSILEYLDALEHTNARLRWRLSYYYPSRESFDIAHRPPDRTTEEVVLVDRSSVYNRRSRTETRTPGIAFVSERLWHDGQRETLELDQHRTITIESVPFMILSFENLTQLLVPLILIDNPSSSNPIVNAIRTGQIIYDESTESEAVITFFVNDRDLDRFTIKFAKHPEFKLLSLDCDQAVVPVDRPFEDRVCVHNHMTVQAWREIGGVQTPSRVMREIVGLLTSAVPPEKWPENADEHGRLIAHELWELIEIGDLDKNELEARRARFVPVEGDFVNDRRLDLGYTIGGDYVVQGSEVFRLPSGERITAPLDGSFLQRLPELRHVPHDTTPPRTGRSQSPLKSGALVVGGLLMTAGAGLLVLSRRRR